MSDRFKKLIRRHEGYSPERYDDTKGIPTVGVGANLQTSESHEILKDLNIPFEDVLSGNRKLTPQEAETILNRQLEEKQRYFNTIKEKDFPESDITPEEEEALLSLGFNSPKLWGPNLRRYLKENRDIEAAKEILLRSNKDKTPDSLRLLTLFPFCLEGTFFWKPPSQGRDGKLQPPRTRTLISPTCLSLASNMLHPYFCFKMIILPLSLLPPVVQPIC